MRVGGIVGAVVVAGLAAGGAAAAPAVFVGSGAPVTASQLVIVRDGARTSWLIAPPARTGPVLIAVPVPARVVAADVGSVPRRLVDRLDATTAPRIAEVRELDPCSGAPLVPAVVVPSLAPAQADPAELAVIADPVELAAWLAARGLPAAEATRAALARSDKLVVALIDPRTTALRIQLPAGDLPVPLDLGADADSAPPAGSHAPHATPGAHATHDLSLYVLAPTRVAAANRPNVALPTNVELAPAEAAAFPAYFAAQRAALPARAVVTEYAWAAAACETCAVPPLDAAELAALGAPADAVVTRLHVRDASGSLALAEAPAIAGGAESVLAAPAARAASANRFLARYVLRRPWTGPLTCAAPVRGRWQTVAARIGGSASEIARAPQPAPAAVVAPVATVPGAEASGGVGCSTSGGGAGLAAVGAAIVGIARRRRRRA